MKLELLSGIEGIEEDAISGFGGIARPDVVTRALMKNQSALLGVAGLKGLGAADLSRVVKDLRINRFAILCNGMPERDHVLKILPYVDDITTNGSYKFKSDAPVEAIEDYLSGVIDLGLLDGNASFRFSEDDLGRVKKSKRSAEDKADHQEKQAALDSEFEEGKKTKGKGILKKVARGLVRFNPLTLAARGGFLLLLRINLFKMSSKLKLGYLSESEAAKMGLDIEEWKKLKTTLTKIENLYVKIGGKADKMKSVIIKGGKGLKVDADVVQPTTVPDSEEAAKATDVSKADTTGADDLEGLGVLPAVPPAVAAASGLIASVGAFLKKINFKKLVGTAKVLAPAADAPGKDGAAAPGEKAPGLFKKIANKVKDVFKPGAKQEGFESDAEKETYTGVTEGTNLSADKVTTPEPEGTKSNALMYGGIAVVGLGLAYLAFK